MAAYQRTSKTDIVTCESNHLFTRPRRLAINMRLYSKFEMNEPVTMVVNKCSVISMDLLERMSSLVGSGISHLTGKRVGENEFHINLTRKITGKCCNARNELFGMILFIITRLNDFGGATFKSLAKIGYIICERGRTIHIINLIEMH